MIPNSVTRIGTNAFLYCTSLFAVNIPNSVTNISDSAFFNCTSLNNIVIGSGITSIENDAFYDCTSLKNIYFAGNAPTPNNDTNVFLNDINATVYYMPKTIGWGLTFDGLPTVLWNPQAQKDASFGVQNNQFGFNITGSSNLVIVVEACTNLVSPSWSSVGTNTLIGSSSYFSDPVWTNYPARFYRFRSP